MKLLKHNKFWTIERDGPVLFANDQKVAFIAKVKEGIKVLVILDTMHRHPRLGIGFTMPDALFEWMLETNEPWLIVGQDKLRNRRYKMRPDRVKFMAITREKRRVVFVSLNAFTVENDVKILRPPRKKKT